MEDQLEIKKHCIVCEDYITIQVYKSGYEKWKSGVLIQNALPELNPSEREMLMSGICPLCWDKLMYFDE